MTLRQKQSLFLKNFALLIIWAFENGYEVTAGELHRTDEQHAFNIKAGKTKAARSQHQDRLAGDLNLFISGVYITDTAKYAPLGKYWRNLHPLNRWGGDWNKNGDHKDENFSDGNHFEMQ
jgi:hypothetical protein